VKEEYGEQLRISTGYHVLANFNINRVNLFGGSSLIPHLFSVSYTAFRIVIAFMVLILLIVAGISHIDLPASKPISTACAFFLLLDLAIRFGIS
jgi:hypothetical protein